MASESDLARARRLWQARRCVDHWIGPGPAAHAGPGETGSRFVEYRRGSDPPKTSASLLAGVVRREPESERRLMYLYEPLIYRRCRDRVYDEAAARDITQEVFLTAFIRIDGFRTGEKSFLQWLYAILRNKIGDHIRQGRMRPRAAGGTTAQAALEQHRDAVGSEGGEVSHTGGESRIPDEVLLCRRAIELTRAEFGDKTWRAAWLRIVEDRPAREVAHQLEMSPGAVWAAQSRVLKRVREIHTELREPISRRGTPTEED